MNNRFMLTAAGAATAAFAASASAELLTFNYDYFANPESGWSISDSDGNVVMSAALGVVGSTSLSYSDALYFGAGSSPYPNGYIHLVDVALAAGDYSITLTDTWGRRLGLLQPNRWWHVCIRRWRYNPFIYEW